ncbi:MAG: alpha/beta hydrolase [Oscillospiraceae bacterium]
MIKKSVAAAVVPIALPLIVAAAEQINRRAAAKNYPCRGAQVNVAGRMNVWAQGKGDTAIVCISGYGTPCPAVDFQPLLCELGSFFTCVVPESKGYGASAQPIARRKTQNIVNEIRAALRKAGFKPPYILMGHSMSGFFMPWWCANYPGEVSAVIGIDTSVPEQVNVPAVRNNKKPAGIKEILEGDFGMLRRRVRRGEFDTALKGFCMSMPDKLPQIREICAGVSNGRGIVCEGREFTNNALCAQKYEYPKELPVLMFVSLQMNKAVNALGYDWLEGHKKQVDKLENGRLVTYDAPHYLHHERAAEMAGEILGFLKSAKICD